MKKIVKDLLKIFIFMFLLPIMLVVIFALFWYFNYKSNMADNPEGNIASMENVDGTYKLKVREPEKEIIKGFIKEIKNKIYEEASEHNPTGDVLPDSVDDKIIKDIKNRVE